MAWTSAQPRRVASLLGICSLLASLLLCLPAPATAGSAATLLVSGRLETLALDEPGDPGVAELAVNIVLRDGTRLPVRPDPAWPAQGTISATVPLTGAAARAVGSATASTDSLAGLRLAHRLVEAGTLLPLRGVQVSAPTAEDPTPAPHRAYVAIPTNVGSFAEGSDAAVERLQDAMAFWSEQSDGAISSFDIVTTQVFVSSAAEDSASCGLGDSGEASAVWNEADNLFPGVDFYDAPNHLLVLLPDECQVHHALGMGTIGNGLGNGGMVLAHAERGEATATLAHELGHNVSLRHANAVTCSYHNPTSCPAYEYADMYDVMGFASDAHVLPALNSAHRATLGLLDAVEAPLVELAAGASSRTTVARLAPRSSTSGQRSLAVVDPEDLRTYYLDYRSGTGRDAGAGYTTDYELYGTLGFGTGLTVVGATSSRDTELLTHALPSGDHRGSWQPGETFTNLTGTVSVTVQAIEQGEYVDVSVTLHSDAPSFVDPPTPIVTGTSVVGDTLRVDAGAWPEGTWWTVDWLVDGRVVASGNDDLYLSADYRGAVIRARVTAHAEGYRSVVVTSEPVGPVTRPVFAGVTIWAYPLEVGRPVDSSVHRNPDSASVDYQWRADGVPIPGATAPTFVPTSAEVGKYLSLEVRAAAEGYDTTVSHSEPLGPVPAPALPQLTAGTPTFGAPRVGVRLVADPGAWSAGTAFAYAWLRDGSPIAGASRSAYTPVAADRGRALAVRVTGSKPGYDDLTATSATRTVAAGTLAAPRPRVTGTAKVRATLRAVPGAWAPSAARLSYQWLAGGRPVARATGATLRLTKALRGKRISVRVTGTLSGYASRSATSRPTRAVR